MQVMTHELGHAISLQHEHQRDDRNTYISFHCEKLDGHAEAQRKAHIDGRAWFEDDQGLAIRMALKCDD